MKNSSILALIPARRDSKRLPGKNSMMLEGKPLIAWTIEAALESSCLEEVMVSTNDEQIADIAKKYGAKVPYLRPEKLAGDKVVTFDVVEHALSFYKEKQGKVFDYVLLLQPTSPLRTAADIIKSIRLGKSNKADAIISVCEMDHSPLLCNTLPDNGDMSLFINQENSQKRSQDFPSYYCPNGAIYLCKTERLLEEKSFFLKDNIYAYKMERESSIDIDNKIDFKLAEIIVSERLMAERKNL